MKDTLGLYVHVPFCRRRCPYCAFYSVEGAAEEEINAYARLVLRELALRAPEWRGFSLSSIYLGGGTPSLLKPEDVKGMIQAAKNEFDFSPEVEITFEANPGTLMADSCQLFVEAGISRLSLGIQALDDQRLEFLGRIHDHAEAVKALQVASQIEGLKVSADLMVGTPLETTESWNRELNELMAFKPCGVSFYSLTVEEGTQLAERAEKGEAVYLETEQTVDLLIHIAERLKKAGYRHYEVSNWALPGSESRHNLHYWRRGKYIGIGPSAHSFDGQTRTWNVSSLELYRRALEAGRLPPAESETLDEVEKRTEWVYLSLRLVEGLNFAKYERQFGEVPPYWSVMFEKIADRGLGNFNGKHFKPNDRGLLLADEIAARILG